MAGSLTLEEMRDQVRRLGSVKGFDVSLEQRLAYLTSEVGEVAKEILKLSRDGDPNVGKMDEAQVRAVRESPGMEIYDVFWNLLNLAEKSRLNGSREWRA